MLEEHIKAANVKATMGAIVCGGLVLSFHRPDAPFPYSRTHSFGFPIATLLCVLVSAIVLLKIGLALSFCNLCPKSPKGLSGFVQPLDRHGGCAQHETHIFILTLEQIWLNHSLFDNISSSFIRAGNSA